MISVNDPTRKLNESGFTLIEALVVVALIAIVTAIATPSLTSFLVSSQIRSAINDWTVALQTARSEAVKQRARVTVCPSSNGTTCASTQSYDVGWIVVLPDSTPTANRLLQDYHPLKRVTMTSNKNTASITYLPNGVPAGNFLGMTITVQEDASDPNNSLTRYICIARTGRPRVFNEDQYLNLPSGSCE